MSRYRSDPEMMEPIEPSACGSFLHYTWKAVTCLFSHVTLVTMVVSYCILGAITFAALEKEHELEVKRNITKIRNNVTDQLWILAQTSPVLESTNFTKEVIERLSDFEESLIRAMNKDGWDGVEDEKKLQWTFTGALFYSIIVVTTIGYGHIAPKTPWGKVVTIFYAILGIPLMLLCLSNIGDVMATSFRFLYWRVCCFVCTKPKKPKRRALSRVATMRAQESKSGYRSRGGSFRRSVRTSTKSADSGFGRSELGHTSHSDTEIRYDTEQHPQHQPNNQRGQSLPRMRTTPQQHQRYEAPAQPQRISKRNTFPRRHAPQLDRRDLQETELSLDPIVLARTKILCNKYIIADEEVLENHVPGITRRTLETTQRSPINEQRAASMPRSPTYLEPPRDISLQGSREDLDSLKVAPKRKRSKSPMPQQPPKMMTPLGYGYRSKYLDDPDSDEDQTITDYYDSPRARTRPVPIWLCILLVVSYILAGAFMFSAWEGWKFLDSAYFCFVTLTTIGFGDLVPANRMKSHQEVTGRSVDGEEEATVSIALCSLYLLFGISLLAMSFNLVQEEVIANVKSVARRLGIIKSEEVESDEEDE